MLNINTGLFFLIIISVVVFYTLKSVLKSIVKGFLYTVLVAITLFFLGMWYFLGFERTISVIRAALRL